MELTIITWNCRGLRQWGRREEVFYNLSKLNADFIVLQETNIVTPRDRSAAQRAWTWGPSVWSLAEEGTGGVAILCRFNSRCKISKTIEASPGHLLIIEFVLQSQHGTPTQSFRLCALYAPIDGRRRRNLWQSLRDYVWTWRELIVVGDFNIRSEVMDRVNLKDAGDRSQKPLTVEEKTLRYLLSDTLNLQDSALLVENEMDYLPTHHRATFQQRYVTPRGCTLTRFHPWSASRIDRVWSSRLLKPRSCQLVVNPWSDHVILKIEFGVNPIVSHRVKGRWTLKPWDLKTPQLQREIEVLFNHHQYLKSEKTTNLIGEWEDFKKLVKRRCIQKTRSLLSRELKEYHRAIQSVITARWRIAQGLPYDGKKLAEKHRNIKEYQLKQRRKRRRNQQARSSGPLVEKGEWEKDRVSMPSVQLMGLRRHEGDEVSTDLPTIQQILSDFYKNLYTAQKPQVDVQCYVEENGGSGVFLEKEEVERLTASFVEMEVDEAISAGKSSSAAGLDGLPYGFYQTFKQHLLPILVNLFNTMWQRKEFGSSFLHGLVSLLYKSGDPTLVTNWRPITINNVDYRILMRILNTRLKAFAYKFITPGQTSGIPGRKMVHTACWFRQAFLYLQQEQKQHLLLQLDQQKAFDRVDHEYLWKVLEHQGIPVPFVHFVRSAYLGAKISISVKGTMGDPLRVTRGVRQGCPLSPLLYVLALEPLLKSIKRDKGIKGLWPQTEKHLNLSVLAHADDVYLWLDGEQDLKRARQHLKRYEEASGAKINEQKSKLYVLDGSTTRIRVSPMMEDGGQENKEQTSNEVESIKILGILFDLKKEGWRANWAIWQGRVEQRLQKWRTWRLTTAQKVKYFMTYCIPAANYLASVYPPSISVMKVITRKIFQWIFGTIHFPLARLVIQRKQREGGLGLIDISLWFLVTFWHVNLSQLQRIYTDQGNVESNDLGKAFVDSWLNSSWGQQWWKKNVFVRRLTVVMKRELPDFMVEAAVLTRSYGIGKAELQSNEGDGQVRLSIGTLYWKIFQRARTEPYDEGRKNKLTLSVYLRNQVFPISTFVDKTIPYALKDVQWRAYHQVLQVAAWRKQEKGVECKRVGCVNVGGQETVRHAVKDCVAAQRVWKGVSGLLKWPFLVLQGWETILSGLEPNEDYGAPGDSMAVKGLQLTVSQGGQTFHRQKPKVPWSIVRLINLIVVAEIFKSRQKELATKNSVNPSQTVKQVWQYLMTVKEWEKINTKAKQYNIRWRWFQEVNPPVP